MYVCESLVQVRFGKELARSTILAQAVEYHESHVVCAHWVRYFSVRYNCFDAVTGSYEWGFRGRSLEIIIYWKIWSFIGARKFKNVIDFRLVGYFNETFWYCANTYTKPMAEVAAVWYREQNLAKRAVSQATKQLCPVGAVLLGPVCVTRFWPSSAGRFCAVRILTLYKTRHSVFTEY